MSRDGLQIDPPGIVAILFHQVGEQELTHWTILRQMCKTHLTLRFWLKKKKNSNIHSPTSSTDLNQGAQLILSHPSGGGARDVAGDLHFLHSLDVGAEVCEGGSLCWTYVHHHKSVYQARLWTNREDKNRTMTACHDKAEQNQEEKWNALRCGSW